MRSLCSATMILLLVLFSIFPAAAQENSWQGSQKGPQLRAQLADKEKNASRRIAVVALIGCHQGLRASRSAAGVGAATTSAVVNSIIAVIALDAVFAVCAHALHI